MPKPRRVIIAHGWNDGANNAWINWLAEQLRGRGYEVITPVFPHVHVPRRGEWVSTLEQAAGPLDRRTVLVGYSLGVPTTLRMLTQNESEAKFAGLVLVAGFGDSSLQKRVNRMKWLDMSLDIERIRRRTPHRVVVYADNDPLVRPKHSQRLGQELLAREIVIMGGGHLVGLPQLPRSYAKMPAVLEAVEACFEPALWRHMRELSAVSRSLLARR